MTPPYVSDWRREILLRLEIAPTATAMQRYLLFGRRCSSIEESNPAPGDHRISVTLYESAWTGSGATVEEAMARAVLSLPEPKENEL
jgi:hypothetical protein